MRARTCLATLAVLVLCVTGPAGAETEVGGVICANTTWDLAGSPYVVTVAAGGAVVVGCDATLTIEPGVEVRFEPQLALLVGWSAWGPGTLVARGTEQSPILFTSDEAEPAPGDWGRIDFLDQAADVTLDGSNEYESGCILEHVIVEYAGSGDYAAVNVSQSAPLLRYCEVRENLESGIAVDSAPPLRVEGCYVHDNAYSGIAFSDSPGNTLAGNTITDNSTMNGGGIHFDNSDSNTIGGNTISDNNASMHGGGIYFVDSDSNTLTGNVIDGNDAGDTGGGVYFEHCESTLTGNTITANSARNGGGIYSEYSDSTLTDNTVSGNSVYDTGGGIMCVSDNHTLTGNTISDNTGGFGGGGGIYMAYGSSTLTGNTIRGNSTEAGGGGIFFQFTDYDHTLIGNTIGSNSAGNSGGGISFRDCYGSNSLTANIIEDNTADGEGGAVYLDDSNSNGPFAGNIIRFNHTTGGQTGGIFVTGGSEWVSLNGGTEGYNTICCNDGYEVCNNNTFYGGDARHDIDAANVYWGTDDAGVIQAEVHDFFDDASRAMVVWDPYAWSPPAGDVDCDGVVNLFDVDPFVLALTSAENPEPFDDYYAAFPDCDPLHGDINGDCQLNMFDIDGFVELLTE